jgi:hypothetical protein
MLRTPDPTTPKIMVGWADGTAIHTLENPYLEEYPFFKIFDYNYLSRHNLPKGTIAFRNRPSEGVEGARLNQLIQGLLVEIKTKKKKYANFSILQNKGFNHRKACGLLILKFNEYPFVVKLFIETPESFVNPWSKGVEPIFFFYMGGGVNRHLSGFMRLKNLEYINKKIASDPRWSSIIETPRKWFWMDSSKDTWLSITGNNLGDKKIQQTRIPGTYAIIADAIKAERTFSSLRGKDLQTALDISNFLEANIDLHITNFMVEEGTQKIVLIDTEHFPTMVGDVDKHFDGYLSWYLHLIGKCGKDMFFSTKAERRSAQYAHADSAQPRAKA